MLGFMLNMSNVHSDSQVLLIEHTRGLITGAIMERQAKYCLRVEFGHDSIKINSEILHQFDYQHGPHMSIMSIGNIHGKLLVPCDKTKSDPLMSAMQK